MYDWDDTTNDLTEFGVVMLRITRAQLSKLIVRPILFLIVANSIDKDWYF